MGCLLDDHGRQSWIEICHGERKRGGVSWLFMKQWTGTFLTPLLFDETGTIIIVEAFSETQAAWRHS